MNINIEIILIFNTIILLIFYIIVKWCYNYWGRLGLETPPTRFPVGNTQDMMLMRANIGEQIQTIYDRFRRKGLKHGGMYMFFRPVYIPVDLNIIRSILQSDFQYFMNHGSYYNKQIDPLSAHLFNLNGEEWKNLRTKLAPAFTAGKMKLIFNSIKHCAEDLKMIMNKSAYDNKPIEIKDVFSRFTADVIGSCAFGLECYCLKDPNSEFYKFGRRFFENAPNEALRALFAFALPPNWLKFFGVKMTKPDVEKFFLKIVQKNLDYRKKSGEYREDFFNILYKMWQKHENNEHFKLSLEEIAAQVYVFYVAGYETTAATIAFALYELAKNPNIQDKLRAEIMDICHKHQDQLTYDGINEMHYLEMVLNETLRKYPPFSVMFRICCKDYHVPDTNLLLKKDTLILISTIGIHHDPAYYPEPEIFRPERFDDANKKKRSSCMWMPFGEGPRICVGMRFGAMQSKICLATLLKDYRFRLDVQTEDPLIMEKLGIVITARKGIWLNVETIRKEIHLI